MSDLNIQLILRLVDRATAPARAAMGTLNRIGAAGAASFARSREQAVALAGALGGAAGAAVRLGAGIGVIGGLGLRSFVNEAAEFEKFRVQLENLEGSTQGADRALAWIEDFATRTPLQVDQVVSAYARLKAFGVDPADGTLRALTDTMAANGGGVELLDGLVLALGQSWSKGKLQGEEALQLLERGVPVYDLLAEKLGVSTEEVIRLQAAGELGREEIKLLVEAMAEANAGASEDMASTWDGIISNLWDHWGRFKRLVMDAGLFGWLKARLQWLLDRLNEMAANGDLERWAEQVSATVIALFERIGQIGNWVAGAWETVSPTVARVVDVMGGAENAIIAILALPLAPHLLAIATAAGRLLLALGPFGWALMLIATAAMAIYENWDGFVSYFTDRIDRVRAAFDDGLINGVFATLMEFNPFVLIMDGASALFNYITGWTFADLSAALAPFLGFDPFRTITAAGVRFHKWITSLTFDQVKTALIEAFTVDLYQLGVDMLNSLWEGMKTVMAQLVAWAKEQLASITPDWIRNGNPAALGDAGSGTTGEGDAAMGLPGRAAGGPVRAGMIYRWQENGEELFRPQGDGTVINAQGTRALRAGAGRQTTVNLGGITINAAPGMSPDAIARAVRREIARLTEGAGTELHDGGLYAR